MGLGGLFSKPKVPDPPKIEAPPPIPELDTGAAAKTQRKKTGLGATLITGDLVPQTTGATLLGGI